MQRSLLSALCASALLFASPSSKGSAPVPGPGGVYDAVVDFVEALDRADAAYFKKALTTSRHGLEFFHDKDGKLSTRENEAPFSFHDVAWDGSPISAASLKELGAAAGSLERKGEGKPHTKITNFYADCPSGECSYAVVEFDRYWGESETKTRVAQMRATALVKYVGGEAPLFRVFHWHAAKRH